MTKNSFLRGFHSIDCRLNIKIGRYVYWPYHKYVNSLRVSRTSLLRMPYRHTVRQKNYVFEDLKTLLARATPLRSGDQLAGVAAETAEERVAAQMALADLPLITFLNESVVPYEQDDVTRLIIDSHDASAFSLVRHQTVGELRNFLLSEKADAQTLASLRMGLTPEMVAAVSKLMRNQDLITVAAKCEVISWGCTVACQHAYSQTIPPTICAA
jgi:ethanolamine ammonia-lyase large subunit